jgi:hypothetical protein
LTTARAGADARDVALAAALRQQRLTQVEFKETDLKGIVTWLRVATGRNIVIEQHELAKAGVEWQDLRFSVELRDVSVWTFLDDVVSRPHGMAVVVRGNVVFLTSKARAYGKPVTRLYGISHITWTKIDFIAPPINLKPSGFVDDEYEPEKVVEDDPLNNGDAVAELVKELVQPQGWQENDDWQIRASDRYLVIRAPLSVHARIPRALALIASMK